MFRNTIFLLLLFLKLILNEYFPLSLFYFYRLKIGIYYSFLFLNKSFFLSLSRDLKSTLKNFLIFCVARGLYIDLYYFQVFKFKNVLFYFQPPIFYIINHLQEALIDLLNKNTNHITKKGRKMIAKKEYLKFKKRYINNYNNQTISLEPSSVHNLQLFIKRAFIFLIQTFPPMKIL